MDPFVDWNVDQSDDAPEPIMWSWSGDLQQAIEELDADWQAVPKEDS